MEAAMKTIDAPTDITPERQAEYDEAIRLAYSGDRDFAKMREACKRMDRLREETYRKHGLLDISVPAIRELRDR
jgi:hypothetical protein